MKLRGYQKKAVKAALEGFRKYDRGKILMACGTGKTIVGCKVAEGLQAKTVLVYVPSLLLTRQLLDVYKTELPGAEFLAVCSDIDLASDGPINCQVTTSSAAVKSFLKTDGQKVVVCTYQSAEILKGCKFDIAVFDEAHRTAGDSGKPFAAGLSDRHTKIGKRLFMTATPRHEEIREDGESPDRDVYSMDDEDLYGPVFYALSFAEAIRRKLICDYRVVISVLNVKVQLNQLAVRVAISRAIARYGIRKVFTFHKLVDDAQSFVTGATESFRGLELFHVNGKQPEAIRKAALLEFVSVDRALMSNARCLAEGIDLPAVDMVAFLSAKRSFIDTVQALGRVLRPFPGKRYGYVFLPIFLDCKANEDLETAFRRTRMDHIFRTVQALREQDEILAAELIQHRENAAPPKFNIDFVSEADLHAAANDTQNLETSAISQPPPSEDLRAVERLRKAIQVRLLKPFRNDGQILQEKLLSRAKSGRSKPHESGTREDRNLARFMRRHRELWSLIRKIAPHWFIRSSAQLKKDLLDRASSGESKPTFVTDKKTAEKLSLYLKPGHRCYDAEFANALQNANSAWVKSRGQISREDILQKVLQSPHKPSKHSTNREERLLYERFRNLVRRDKDFKNKMLEIRPDWVPRRNEVI